MLLKRLFDIAVSGAGLVVLSPLFALLCALVKYSSRGPVFFRQKRVGRGARLFTAIKFRTMYNGTEKHGVITAASDPRITRLGRILRRLKIDELPQLWNVLVGNTSLVGPRPDVPGYADRLSGEARKILDLRPGITGPATLYFRFEEQLLAAVPDPARFNDEVLWPMKVAMNLNYLKSWSFWRDIGFILITLAPLLNRFLKLIPDPPLDPEALRRLSTFSP